MGDHEERARQLAEELRVLHDKVQAQGRRLEEVVRIAEDLRRQVAQQRQSLGSGRDPDDNAGSARVH
jgi:hypothetical protein